VGVLSLLLDLEPRDNHDALCDALKEFVMPGLDPGIDAVTFQQVEPPMEWIAGQAGQ
jgi:hypothetical protein